MTCQDIEEISGAYVLGALTSEERTEVEEHLAQCPTCPPMIRELQAVADLLPLTVPEVEPAPDLKARLFERLQTEGGNQKRESSLQSQPQSLQRGQVRSRQRSYRVSWKTMLVAVAALLLLALVSGLAVWNISLQQQVARLSTHATQTASSSYSIPGTNSGDHITGELTCYSQPRICMLVMHGLAQPQGNHVYQGWLLHGKQPTSIGLFNIQNGVATLTFQQITADYDAAAVSLEPGPQASKSAPKGPVIALGSLSKSTKVKV